MLIEDRIKLIIKANNLSPSEFADQVDIKRANLSHVLSGRNKPSLEFLKKVISSFPNVNASWLITGETRDGQYTGADSVQEESNEITGDSSEEAQAEKEDEIEKIIVLYKNGTFKTYTN